ncbi:PucR family transcriptional regulator [Microbacterium sp. GXF7504]
MADRPESGIDRTDRPAGPGLVAGRVRDVLAIDAVRAGMPEVAAGREGLDAPVRWVHASDNPDVARLLDGGELLLTTGSAWPTDDAALEALVERFVAVGIAGIVLELGTRFARVPEAVVRTADRHALAVVALHREIRFVAVTEAVHARIIAAQTTALAARDDVRERFTALALRGAPTDHVVRQASQTLGSGVVLENLAHEVVVAAFADVEEEAALVGWIERSRLDRDDLLRVPVEARGSRWGRLIALPGPEHPAGRRSVLEQAAIALAIGRLAEGGTAEWDRFGSARMLHTLLDGRFAHETAVTARLEAAGFPVRGRVLVGLALRGGGDASAIGAALPPGARVLVAARGRVTGVLASLPAGTRVDDAAAERLLAVAGRGGVVAIGHDAHAVDAALGSVREAVALAEGSGAGVLRAEDRPLARLIGELSGDHRLLAHGERMLAPLLAHDLRKDGDLLDVLEAMLAHPGNRTAAAAASHLSRSVFYQRLERIEQLLGVDLDDGETQTALHLAVLSRRR